MECPVCLEQIPLYAFAYPCIHEFCGRCAERLKARSSACPICRRNVSYWGGLGAPHVFVLTDKNEVITMSYVDFSFTVLQLKREIERKARVPPDQQLLTFMGSVLADDNTLKECNISRDSLLLMDAR